MVDQTGRETVTEVIGIGDGEEVTRADIAVLSEAVGDADETFEVDITLVCSIEWGGSGDFKVEVKYVSAIMRVVVSSVIFTKRFHQANAVNEFGFIGIEAVFDGDDGVQSEMVSEIVPHGDARCDGGFTTKISAACGEGDLGLSGE